MRCLGLAVLFFLPLSLFSQDLLFQEDFGGGLIENEWRAGFHGNSMDVESMANNPSGDGWVGMLGNHFSGGNVGATHSAMQFSDFYYEAQVFIPVDEGVYYGIEFRVDTSDLSAGYQFVARFLPGGMVTPRLRFRVRPLDNPGMPAVIRDWDASEIPGGIPTESGWHKMAVKAAGHRFWFYYDDQELPGSPIMDFTYLSGAIGAYVWDTSSPLMNLYIDDINVYSDIPTGISEIPAAAASPSLSANWPNPVHAVTTVTFDLPDAAHAVLAVYDLRGREVARIADTDFAAGRHSMRWDAAGIPDGSYLLRLLTSTGSASRMMTVLR